MATSKTLQNSWLRIIKANYAENNTKCILNKQQTAQAFILGFILEKLTIFTFH